jgi:Domain of unknown function (DUF5916)/Carbohydrate family 9 binding domain-like
MRGAAPSETPTRRWVGGLPAPTVAPSLLEQETVGVHRQVLVATLATGLAVSAAAAPRPEPTPAPPVEAARTTDRIHVDGRLDDAAWSQVEPFSAFLQRDPDEGQPATERTELRLVYDDAALYVGARLFDREPDRIERRLSRRDAWAEADRFVIFLDPRGDRRTGVRFQVTAAGVQRDEIIFNDTWTDDSWDALWTSAVSVDDDGWSVEMRIPFAELRFLPGDSRSWGVNALRVIQRKNESDWLALVPKSESGLASRMAPLLGIEGVEPRTPLVLVPYASTGASFSPVDPGDPFHDGSSVFGNVGLDLRRKVGGAFALDATVNPDFGQVEVDPAVVNLSDFETFFPEKRPFFVEGSQIFDSFGRNGPNNFYGFMRSEPDLFYTRRIGRAPQREVEADYVSAPAATTILGAVKITGKSSGGWSVGVLEAVTGKEWAQWSTGGERGSVPAEPLSNYFVSRVYRDRDRAGYGLLLTAVNRNLGDPGLAAQLPGSAFVGGVDGHLFLDDRKDWVVAGRLAGSVVEGSREAIEGLQLASTRYFQRPDRPELRLDPARTTLEGWTGSVNLNRQSGNVRVNAALWATSPGFESNDLGFNPRSDRWGGHVALQWRKSETDSLTRFRSLTVAKAWSLNFDGDRQGDAVSAVARAHLLNYWNVGLNGSWRIAALDDRQTRGGPSMRTANGLDAGFWVESDDRKSFVGRIGAWHHRNAYGSRYWETEAAMEVHPSPGLSLSLGPSFTKKSFVAQWVASIEDGALPSDLAGHYVFAGFEQTEVALTARLNWIFSPRLSLQVYTQPLVSRADYTGFKELESPRSFDFLVYGPDQIAYDPVSDTYAVDPGRGSVPVAFDNPDFNLTSFRVNAVLRWEWRPGSALYAVWTQQREADAASPSADLASDVDTLFAAPPTDSFQVKATFRLGD